VHLLKDGIHELQGVIVIVLAVAGDDGHQRRALAILHLE